LTLCLAALIDLLNSQTQRSVGLNADLKTISNLANEICGECMPRSYAPALKQWMDQIQELAKKLA